MSRLNDKLAVIPVVLLACVIIASCKPSGQMAETSPAEQTFRSNCQACHRLPKPNEKSDLEWPLLVERYGEKAKLSQIQIDDITSWLIANN